MKTGLAIWHYPHRTLLENVAYFAAEGFASVSVHGHHFSAAMHDPEEAAALAGCIRETGVELTVHHKLPASHDPEVVEAFYRDMDAIGAWQAQYGLLSVLSYDMGVRDGVRTFLEYVLDHVPGSRIAVEDYGLTHAEYEELAPLRENPRFGYLVDVGHMLIRLTGDPGDPHPSFTYREREGCGLGPDEEGFYAAIAGKDFPVFEMHLHNNNGRMDEHRFLEDGVLDMHIMARVLKRLGYRGIVTLEPAPGFAFPCFGQEADDRVRATRAFWERCVETAG